MRRLLRCGRHRRYRHGRRRLQRRPCSTAWRTTRCPATPPITTRSTRSSFTMPSITASSGLNTSEMHSRTRNHGGVRPSRTTPSGRATRASKVGHPCLDHRAAAAGREPDLHRLLPLQCAPIFTGNTTRLTSKHACKSKFLKSVSCKRKSDAPQAVEIILCNCGTFRHHFRGDATRAIHCAMTFMRRTHTHSLHTHADA